MCVGNKSNDLLPLGIKTVIVFKIDLEAMDSNFMENLKKMYFPDWYETDNINLILQPAYYIHSIKSVIFTIV